jgi:hypothetical protein
VPGAATAAAATATGARARPLIRSS